MVSQRSATILRAAVALTLSASVSAAPAGRVEQRDTLGFFDDVLLFDSPAVLSNPPRVEIQAYTYWRQFDIDLGPIGDLLGGLFGGIDLGDLDDQAGRIAERTKLLLSVPRTDKEVELTIPGCGDHKLAPTSDEVDGISITSVSCAAGLKAGAPITATVDLDSRGPTAKIFASPPDGFGIISDLDDTIKISNVLDKIELVKNTFLNEPKVVAGMPELYASLRTSLKDPLFNYISGSPFQLYPFVSQFIAANYPDGPKFLRNVTVFDLPNLVEVLTDKENTLKSKLVSIDRLVALYPAKKFLMIGDSTEKDPETYAEAFKRHPNSVACIWIRAVDGAANTAERFTAAFAGVHAAKIRVFTDAQIGGLKDIKVASGQC